MGKPQPENKYLLLLSPGVSGSDPQERIWAEICSLIDTWNSGISLNLSWCDTWQGFPLAWLHVF